MSWRMAESLEQLRRQLNAAFPQRSRVSDGGIGDAAHASRNSDHNPWVKDAKGRGVVTARDFTHDPAHGLDCHRLASALVESKDRRIKYIIWNRQICSSGTAAWQWRPYRGANAHTHHLHISVKPEAKFYDASDEWDLDIARTRANSFADLRDDEIELPLPAELSANASHAKPSHTANAAQQENESSTPEGGHAAAVVTSTSGEGADAHPSAPNQTAENITNVVNASSNVPENFTPEDKTVEAPPPSGMLKKAWGWVLGLGLVPPSAGALIESVRNLSADGSLNLRDSLAIAGSIGKFIFPYVIYVALAFVVLWGAKELLKQISLLVKIWVTARADMNNVEVRPVGEKKSDG